MKKSLKQKLALFLALIMLFAMSMPASLIAGAADLDNDGVEDEVVTPEVPVEPEVPTAVPALNGDLTNMIDPATIAAKGIEAFAGEGAENLMSTAFNTKLCGNIVAGIPVEISFATTQAVVVQSYTLTSGGDSATYSSRDPKTWTLYGSEDNATWVELDSRVGQGFGKNSLTKVFPFENDKAYTYYKLVINEINGGTMMQLCAIQIGSMNLADQDADKAAAAEAAAFDEKLAAFAELSHDEQTAQMVALRAEFNALDAAAQARVTKLSVLKAAEAYVAKLDVVPLLDALVAEIDTAMEAGIDPLTGTYDYHISGMITEALALVKDLGDAAAHIDTDKLEGYRATLDAALPFATTVGTINSAGATKNPWLESMTAEDIEATKLAVVDELTWQYTRAGYLLGTGYLNGEINLDAAWGAQLMSQQENADGVTSPWKADQNARFWSAVMVPFAGTAFSATGYMGSTDVGFTVLSDNFIYNGRVYQQRWDCIMSYAYGYEAPYINGDPTLAADPVLQQENGFPGYNGAGDATNNTFRLAYALYNTEHKLEGKVLGIPSANTVVGDKVIYQAFESADGIAYIAGSASAIAAVTANNPEQKAFAISGDILTAILGEDDFATAIEKTGAPITAVDADGVQLFENGVATADGFEAYSADNEYLKVITLIDGLPTAITRENMAAVETAIANAKAAYEALTANKNKVENYEALTTLEDELKTFKADTTAADAVAEMIAALPIATEVSVDDQADIEAARDAFDALTPDQQGLVENSADLVSAEAALVKAINAAAVAKVEELIDALPAHEAIDGDGFDAAAALVKAAEEAYNGLTNTQANDISDDRYIALMEKIEIVAAGGYSNWNQLLPGDVDASGVVDVADILKLKALIMTEEYSDAELAAGDMNESGSLDVGDIMGVKTIIMGA